MKLQYPSTKLQRNINIQAPNVTACKAFETLRHRAIVRARGRRRGFGGPLTVPTHHLSLVTHH
jgi:hypothetical protein